jgi:hypothetical protein
MNIDPKLLAELEVLRKKYEPVINAWFSKFTPENKYCEGFTQMRLALRGKFETFD